VFPELLLFHGFPYLLWTPPSQVRSYRPQQDRDCPRGATPPTGPDNFRGLHSLGTLPGNAPTPSPNRDFYLIPCGFTIQAWLWPGALSPGHCILFLATRALEIHLIPSQVFDHGGLDLHWSPYAFPTFGLPHFGAFPQGLPLVAFPPLPLTSQDRSPRPQEDVDSPRGVLPPTSLGHFGD
jgi:hypothetical protein